MDKIIKINKILKWILIVGMILFVFLILKYGLNDCVKCSFEYEGKTLNYAEVWELYMDKCLMEFTTKEGSYNLNFTNFTIK